jgi:hypothetical protein
MGGGVIACMHRDSPFACLFCDVTQTLDCSGGLCGTAPLTRFLSMNRQLVIKESPNKFLFSLKI